MVVINIVNNGGVHVVHRAVIGKITLVPISPLVTAPYITVAVINSAIEAHVLTPIAVMPVISPAAICPIRRRP
jgi:hypothetical protein